MSESSSDFECQACHERATQVIDSRGGPGKLGHSIRRRRRCLKCGFRFTTYETTEHPAQIFTRISRARRAFDELQRALRDAPADAIEEARRSV